MSGGGGLQDFADKGGKVGGDGSHGVDAVEHGVGFGEQGFVVAEEREQGLAGLDGVAFFGMDFDAGMGAHRVSGTEAPSAEALDSPADLGAVEDVEESGGVGAEGAAGCGLVESFRLVKDAGVSVLGFDEVEPGAAGCSAAEEVVGQGGTRLRGGGLAGEVEHPSGEDAGEVEEIA